MDVELMHHYTSTAYKTIATAPHVQEALQKNLPKEGLRYPFLMHQILAFAGFHLAYTQPQQRHIYLKQASQHQNFTIHGMRKTLLGSISSENCHATYATSILISLGAFAIYPCYEKFNTFFSPVDSLAEIFTLITGMGLILSTSDEELRTGPLRRLFRKKDDAGGTSSDAPDHPCPLLSGRLPLLEAQLDELFSAEQQQQPGGSSSEAAAGDCLKRAVAALETCLNRVATQNSGLGHAALRAAFLWPLLLPAEYPEWIRCRQPAALVVLAHYALVLHSAEADCWYLQGWGKAIVEAVADALADTPWLGLARWPISIIRGG
ncbi:hypothetical protein Daus18300_000997 [Diaporthe australafricana]|uniref:Uncharacterized protein n=1 Tax=Diaporthe australafricana TaxID=127596 RepID=A0ABR3Y1L3_9PEZI